MKIKEIFDKGRSYWNSDWTRIYFINKICFNAMHNHDLFYFLHRTPITLYLNFPLIRILILSRQIFITSSPPEAPDILILNTSNSNEFASLSFWYSLCIQLALVENRFLRIRFYFLSVVLYFMFYYWFVDCVYKFVVWIISLML